MKKSRYTEEQIAYALKQAEAGTSVAEVIRRMGISEQTFYRWKKLYGGLGVGELRRLKQLEDENRNLKQLVADLSLDKHILQDVLSKNVWSAPALQGSSGFERRQFLHKCIRPLASGLLLQPGHDEMRTHRSQIALRAQGPLFCQGLRHADRLFVHHFHTPQFTRDRSCAGRIAPLVGCARAGEHRPRHPGDLRGHRDDDLVSMHAAVQAIEPGAELVLLAVEMGHAGTRAMHKQATNIGVASLADAEKRRLPAGRVLPRNEAEPCRKISGPRKLSPVSDRREQRRRVQGSEAGNRQQTANRLASRGQRLDLLRHLGKPTIQKLELVPELAQHAAHRQRQIVRCIAHDAFDRGFQLTGPLMDRDAIFETEGAHLADQLRAIADDPIADSVERLHVDLFDGLDLHEPHRRTGHSLGDRFGIPSIVLVRFDERLHKLRRHNAHVVTHRDQLSRQPLRAGTGLHADQRFRRCGEERRHRPSRQLQALDGFTFASHPTTSKRFFPRSIP